MKEQIKYIEAYQQGKKDFESRQTYWNVGDYDRLLNKLSWGAFYNDGGDCQSDEESYFVVIETIGIPEGNAMMDEILANTLEGAA